MASKVGTASGLEDGGYRKDENRHSLLNDVRDHHLTNAKLIGMWSP